MNTILVPTDFSATAIQAEEYAAHLAKAMNARMILFNAFSDPQILVKLPFYNPLIESMEKQARNEVQDRLDALRKQFGTTLQIEGYCSYGSAAGAISQAIREKNADLVVMGVKGMSDIEEKVFGSVALSTFRRAECPVLAIPKDASFQSIRRLALAFDDDQESEPELEPLKQIADVFNAHIYAFSVSDESPELITDSSREKRHLQSLMEDQSFSLRVIEETDVARGINHFVAENHIDMLAIVPGSHSAFWHWLHKSVTTEVAFATKIPLLALKHETDAN